MKLIIAIALVCSALTADAALVNRTTYNAGTNALASQIAAKQGIIWTNSAGIVTPAGGQAETNRLQFVSGAADNATNVAAVVDTAEAWSDGLLQTWRNLGTNQLSVGVFGGLSAHGGIEYFGAMNDGTDFASWGDVAAGFPNRFGFESVRVNGSNYGLIDIYGSDLSAYFSLDAKQGSGFTNQSQVFFSSDPAQANNRTFGRLLVAGSEVTSLRPDQIATSTAYKFGTSRTHTSGNLADIQNNGTNQVSVTFDGALITQGGVVKTPSAANATGTAGTIAWDASFVYICVATDTWKRVAIATW